MSKSNPIPVNQFYHWQTMIISETFHARITFLDEVLLPALSENLCHIKKEHNSRVWPFLKRNKRKVKEVFEPWPEFLAAGSFLI